MLPWLGLGSWEAVGGVAAGGGPGCQVLDGEAGGWTRQDEAGRMRHTGYSQQGRREAMGRFGE